MTLPNRREFERRRAERRACPHAPQLQLVPEASFQPLKGRVKDVSTTGIGLLCDEPFAVGIALALQWPVAADQSMTVLARVVHATPQSDGSVLVGCQFANPLTADELSAVTGGPAQAPHRIRRAVLSADFVSSVLKTASSNAPGTP
jgi:hypothetical protein